MIRNGTRRIRDLYQYTAGYKRLLWMNFILQPMQYLANLFLSAYGYQYMMDGLLEREFHTAFKGVILFFTGLILSGGIQAVATYLVRLIRVGISTNLREALLAAWIDARTNQDEEAFNGDMLTRHEEDSQKAANIFSAQLPALITPIIVCFVCLIAIAARSLIVGGITLLSLVFVFILNWWYAPKYQAMGQQIQEASSNMTQSYKNEKDGADVIRLFGAHDIFLKYGDYAARRLYHSQMKDAKLRTKQGILGNLLGYSSATIPLVVSGILVGLGKLAFSSILYIQKLASNLVWFTGSFLEETAAFQKSLASVERLYSELSRENEAAAFGEQKVIPDVIALETEHLSVKYQGEAAIKDINLVVQEGEHIALVGYSGSGKSSFVKAILQLVAYDGNIKLFGKTIYSYSYSSFRDSFSYISQDIKLFQASIYENIQYGNPEASREEVVNAAKQSYAHEFIISLDRGYDTIIHDKGVSLSGGQLQRIAIARAFLKNAPILLVDEATSALDPYSESKITGALAALGKDRTVITVSHKLSSTIHADRIYVFHQHGIAEEGTYEELVCKKGVFYKILRQE